MVAAWGLSPSQTLAAPRKGEPPPPPRGDDDGPPFGGGFNGVNGERFDDFQSVEAGYALVVSSVAKALRRLTMGPKEFFNLVNSHKQFFVTRSDVVVGVQKLSDYQVPESHPALQKLLGKLDPEGYGELTLPMLKKFWLPEFKTATAVKASVRAKAKSSTFEERHMQHPTLSKNNRGSSLTSNPKSPRSTGGWGNRTVRRKAQDDWQETLMDEHNKLGWGAAGYKAYEPKEIKVEVPPGAVVGTARAKKIELPKDPEAAKAFVAAGVKNALLRLKLSPLMFYNLANRKKAKFLTEKEVSAALHQLTKMDVKHVMKDVMKVLDPKKTKKVTLALLKTQLPLLSSAFDDDSKARAIEAIAATAAAKANEVLTGSSGKEWKPLVGGYCEVNVGGGDEEDEEEEKEEEEDSWLPAEVMSGKSADGEYKVRMLSGYEEEDATFEVDKVYVRPVPGTTSGGGGSGKGPSSAEPYPGVPVNPRKAVAGLEVQCWHASQKEFYDATIVKIKPLPASIAATGTSAANDAAAVVAAKEGGEDDEEVAAKVSARELLGGVFMVWSGEDEEEEVPMLYLRSSSTDHEDGGGLDFAGSWQRFHQLLHSGGGGGGDGDKGEGEDQRVEREAKETKRKAVAAKRRKAMATTGFGLRFILTLAEINTNANDNAEEEVEELKLKLGKDLSTALQLTIKPDAKDNEKDGEVEDELPDDLSKLITQSLTVLNVVASTVSGGSSGGSAGGGGAGGGTGGGGGGGGGVKADCRVDNVFSSAAASALVAKILWHVDAEKDSERLLNPRVWGRCRVEPGNIVETYAKRTFLGHSAALKREKTARRETTTRRTRRMVTPRAVAVRV